MEEDLRSPCTEEIAVFRAFARVVAEGSGGFVVIDTAPTGHTLLLLDASESYHREVSRSMSDIPEAVRQLLPRLRDPEFTQVFLVTLPEATPVHEALALQNDLRRAGIEPAGWIVNQSLAPLKVSDPILPTWGKLIVDALQYGTHSGDIHMLLIPAALLMITGVAFAMVGLALERVLDPRLRER